jgi:ceramide glucosyltransferase
VVSLVGVGLLLAHCAAAWLALRRRPAPRGPAPSDVAVVRPLYGLDADGEAALRSLLGPGVRECVFSFQDPSDAALPLARRLAGESGGRARVVVAPVEPGYSGKTSNLLHGVAATRAPLVVLSDADIVVPPGGLERLLAPFADPRVGMVAAVPVCHGARGVWGRLYQAHLNAIIRLEWLPYAAAGLPVGAPGAAVAVRRSALHAAGGIAALGGYLADDAQLGLRIARAGHRVRVGPVVRSLTGPCDFARYRSVVERSAVIFGCTLPWPLFALHLLFNYGYLAALAVPGWRLPALTYLAARCLALALVEGSATAAALLPALDLTHVWIFAATLLRRRVTWRGLHYRIDAAGKVIEESPRRSDPAGIGG